MLVLNVDQLNQHFVLIFASNSVILDFQHYDSAMRDWSASTGCSFYWCFIV